MAACTPVKGVHLKRVLAGLDIDWTMTSKYWSHLYNDVNNMIEEIHKDNVEQMLIDAKLHADDRLEERKRLNIQTYVDNFERCENSLQYKIDVSCDG